MKSLSLLNDDTTVKLGDTGTIIQFKATEDGSPVSLKQGQTASFRIKNDIGFLTNVPATTTMNGYVYQLDTSTLSSLVVGTYFVELVINQNNENLIFPDEGFVTFNISANALNITGEQLPVMSLDTFKQELQQYTDNQVTNAEQTIQNNFNNYVKGIQDSTIKQAQSAYKFTNNYNLDDLFSGSIPGVPTPVDFNHIPQGIYSGNGWSSAVNKVSGFPSFAMNKFFLLEVFNVQNSYVIQRISLADGTTYEQVLNSDYSISLPWTEISATASNPTITSISSKVDDVNTTTNKLNIKFNDLIQGIDITAIAGKSVTSFDNILNSGTYVFNAWTSNVQGLTNVPFSNCWGTLIVIPFGAIATGNVVQIAINDKNVIKYRTSINNSFSSWNSINIGG